MTDTTVASGEAQAADPSKLVVVPITKAKGETVTINLDDLPDDVYREALLQGLKVLVNRGTSKVTKSTYPDADELKAKAVEVAQEQVKLILAPPGAEKRIKFTGQKKAKTSGAVMTEAMRIARNIVKDELKKAKIKISHVAAKDITAAAKALIEQDEDREILKQAEENLKERAKAPVKIKVTDLIKVDPKKVEADEKKKAEAKATLSALQAGKVKTRAKPASATAH